MTGWGGNPDPASFHQADVAEGARRVADVLMEERADVFTHDDWHGTYGHPDHVKVPMWSARSPPNSSSTRCERCERCRQLATATR